MMLSCAIVRRSKYKRSDRSERNDAYEGWTTRRGEERREEEEGGEGCGGEDGGEDDRVESSTLIETVWCFPMNCIVDTLFSSFSISVCSSSLLSTSSSNSAANIVRCFVALIFACLHFIASMLIDGNIAIG